MAHSVIFKPENSALVRSQGPEDSMPDSGKFKDLYLNSAVTYPCQGGGLTGRDGIRTLVIVLSTLHLISWVPVRQRSGGAGLPRSCGPWQNETRLRNSAPSSLVRWPVGRTPNETLPSCWAGQSVHASTLVCYYCVFLPPFRMYSCAISASSLESGRNRPKRAGDAGTRPGCNPAPVTRVLRRAAARNGGET